MPAARASRRLSAACFNAIDADRIEEEARLEFKITDPAQEPTDTQRDHARDKLVGQSANVFTGPLIDLIDTIRREKEQTIDHEKLDTVLEAAWDGDAKAERREPYPGFRRLP